MFQPVRENIRMFLGAGGGRGGGGANQVFKLVKVKWPQFQKTLSFKPLQFSQFCS